MLEGFVPFPPEFQAKYREKGYWRDKSLRDEFDAVFKKYSGKTAIIDGKRQLTYAELDASPRRIWVLWGILAVIMIAIYLTLN